MHYCITRSCDEKPRSPFNQSLNPSFVAPRPGAASRCCVDTAGTSSAVLRRHETPKSPSKTLSQGVPACRKPGLQIESAQSFKYQSRHRGNRLSGEVEDDDDDDTRPVVSASKIHSRCVVFRLNQHVHAIAPVFSGYKGAPCNPKAPVRATVTCRDDLKLHHHNILSNVAVSDQPACKGHQAHLKNPQATGQEKPLRVPPWPFLSAAAFGRSRTPLDEAVGQVHVTWNPSQIALAIISKPF